jgi:hypothetical protein
VFVSGFECHIHSYETSDLSMIFTIAISFIADRNYRLSRYNEFSSMFC